MTSYRLRSRLEFVVQVLRNPRGGGKRKINKTLDCEILNKKRRHLYMVHNKNNQLCFAICLAQHINPDLTDKQALERGRELQHLAGLTNYTPVALSEVNKFEQIVKCKIVVFCRGYDDRALSPFETVFPKSRNPMFLFLFQNHYYGIITDTEATSTARSTFALVIASLLRSCLQ
ncbi:hypothetical protein F2P81_007466 [Scophthalmus maximus]|uniref:Uncharacterized protein n=1 Tax=Scophthalmus maximus TaxID=52904 RepID=A0A6A4T838_SCOMX|nr:hypothetical protein F2P81_007466 [Scophthalmus maximus]